MGYKSRGSFLVEINDERPKCFSKSTTCSNVDVMCNECIKIQGEYTLYVRVGEDLPGDLQGDKKERGKG